QSADRRPGRSQTGHEGRYTVLIMSIGIAVLTEEISLLEASADQYVGGHAGREQQMADGQARGRPENEQESRIEWQPEPPVEPAGLEGRPLIGFATAPCPGLPDAPQLQQIDVEGAYQDDAPS